jgi:hypothetical protein
MRGRHAVTILLRALLIIVLAVVTTLLSLRLLGSRRGWGTALLSAVVGWGTAIVVALGVNDWEWGADELFIHLLAAVASPCCVGIESWWGYAAAKGSAPS